MRALATYYHKCGKTVMGCDKTEAMDLVCELEQSIYVEDISNHTIDKNFIYIVGNSFLDHPKVVMMKNLGCIVREYREIIEELVYDTKIAVSGSHGKTTTTKMLSTILDSSSIVGDGSATYVDQDYLVFEACEYKNTFLAYHPEIAVILNCDHDHVDYFKTKADYINSFIEFSKNSKVIVYNKDDINLKELKHKNGYTFSLKDKESDLYCEYKEKKIGYKLKLYYCGKVAEMYFPYDGIHMIYDFLACYLTARLLGVEHDDIVYRLDSFIMPKRRMEINKKNNTILVLDYAHHPSEIESTYKALRKKYPNHKVVGIYEGHTLSRSLYFKNEIKENLKKFDDAYLYPLYLSRESDMSGVKEFYKELRIKLISKWRMNQYLKKENVVLVFMGAGKIDKYYKEILNF